MIFFWSAPACIRHLLNNSHCHLFEDTLSSKVQTVNLTQSEDAFDVAHEHSLCIGSSPIAPSGLVIKLHSWCWYLFSVGPFTLAWLWLGSSWTLFWTLSSLWSSVRNWFSAKEQRYLLYLQCSVIFLTEKKLEVASVLWKRRVDMTDCDGCRVVHWRQQRSEPN